MNGRHFKGIWGYTLVEVIVTVIVLSSMASLAIPRFYTVVESFRAKEGGQTLVALLGAQLSADVDVASGRIASYDINYIDVVIPASDYFDGPALLFDGATANTVTINAVAYTVYAVVERTGGAYFMYIQADGTILCDTQAVCQKMGYAPW